MTTKQTERNKRYQAKNKEKTRYQSRRSTARNFISNDVQEEDIEEFELRIIERKKYFKNIQADA